MSLQTPARSLVLALVVLAAGAVVAGAAWWAVGSAPPLAGAVQSIVGAADTETGSDSGGGGSDDRPRLTVVGDGFTAGTRGADGERTTTWPAVLCRDLGCSLASYAAPGTGWTTAGSGGQTVAGSLDDVVASRPDVVVVAVGSADVGAGLPRVRGSVNQVLYRLGRRLPGVPVVVLSPISVVTPAPDDVAAVRRWVADAVAARGSEVVDVSDVLDGADPALVDAAGRPTGRGQEVLAATVEPAVAAALDHRSRP